MTLYIEVIPQQKARSPKGKKPAADKKPPILIETVPAPKGKKGKKSRKS